MAATAPTATTELSVGAQLPSREALLFRNGDARHVLDAAVQAEELGFDSVWVGDSLTARPRFEPLTLLAAVASVTSRVTVGTAVLLPALRHPVLTAHQIATVDRVAGGRLVLGVGAGAGIPATEQELVAVGVPFEQRVGRLYETVRLWRHLWTEPGTTWEGRHWSFDDLNLEPRPATPGGPPLWLAGEGPHTLERAGRLFDGWLPFSATADAFASGLAAVQEAALDGGRSPESVTAAAYLTVTIDDDPDVAVAAQTAHMEAYYGAPYEFMKAFQGCCAGTSETVLGWLQGYVEAGARHLVLRVGTPDDVPGQLERLSEVAEVLRDRNSRAS